MKTHELPSQSAGLNRDIQVRLEPLFFAFSLLYCAAK